MYILHESGDSYNGASRSALSIISGISKKSDRVFVVIPKGKGRVYSELIKIPNVVVLEEHLFRWKRRKNKNRFKQLISYAKYHLYEKRINRKLAKKLSKIAVSEGVDLIHSNSSVIDIGGLIYKETKIPHIWHIREFGEEDFDMYPMDHISCFYHFIEQNSTRVICVSKALKAKLSKYIKEDKIDVVYNGVKVCKLSKKNGYHNNLIISGVISEKKGQWIATKAIQILEKRGIHTTLHIAGTGDEDYVERLSRGLNDRIVFHGFVDDMNELREKMDIELICSISEGFGRTVIEGMAAGLLVIGANRGAVPELINDGENGFLFEANNPNSLAGVIEKVILLNNQEKNQIRQKAYNYVEQRFNEEYYIDTIKNLYLDLLKKETDENKDKN